MIEGNGKNLICSFSLDGGFSLPFIPKRLGTEMGFHGPWRRTWEPGSRVMVGSSFPHNMFYKVFKCFGPHIDQHFWHPCILLKKHSKCISIEMAFYLSSTRPLQWRVMTGELICIRLGCKNLWDFIQTNPAARIIMKYVLNAVTILIYQFNLAV